MEMRDEQCCCDDIDHCRDDCYWHGAQEWEIWFGGDSSLWTSALGSTRGPHYDFAKDGGRLHLRFFARNYNAAKKRHEEELRNRNAL